MAAPPPLQRITVTDAVARYLADVTHAAHTGTLSTTTAANYTRDLAEFTDLAGPDTVLDDLTGPDLDTILTAYRHTPDRRYARPKAGPDGHIKTRGEGAQARFRQSVARLFHHATLTGWVRANPMHHTTVRPQVKGLVGAARTALHPDTAALLVDLPAALDEHRRGQGTDRSDMRLALRDEFLLRLLVEAGPKVSEISRTNRTDLTTRPDGTTWLHLAASRGPGRDVPLSPATAAVYDRYLAEERPDPKPRIRKTTTEAGTLVAETTAGADDADRALVLTWRGRRMTPRDIQLMVTRMRTALPAKARQVTPHRLRHTAATLLLATGTADLPTVQAMLGHASPDTVRAYLDQSLTRAVQQHPVTGTRRPSTRRPRDSTPQPAR